MFAPLRGGRSQRVGFLPVTGVERELVGHITEAVSRNKARNACREGHGRGAVQCASAPESQSGLCPVSMCVFARISRTSASSGLYCTRLVDRRYAIHSTHFGSRPFAQYTVMPFNTQFSIHCVNYVRLPQRPLTLNTHTCRPSPCLLYTSPSPRDRQKSRMPSSA